MLPYKGALKGNEQSSGLRAALQVAALEADRRLTGTDLAGMPELHELWQVPYEYYMHGLRTLLRKAKAAILSFTTHLGTGGE